LLSLLGKGPPVKYCACEHPDHQVAEGIELCGACGERIPDPMFPVILAEVQSLRRLVETPGGEGAQPAGTAANGKLALTRTEAAKALGMGGTSFDKHVRPHVRAVRRGKLRLYPVDELKRWLEENSERALQ
jgi:hypothetical protein